MGRFIVWIAVACLWHVSVHAHRPLLKPLQTVRVGKVDNIGAVRYLPKTGDYLFEWTGFRGNKVRAVYVPCSKVRVSVVSSVERAETGEWLYTYRFHHLKESPLRLSWVLLMMDEEPSRVWVSGGMGFDGIKETYLGRAASFSAHPGVAPDTVVTIRLLSAHPPLLSRCYVRGDAPLMRVPEEMPTELADLLPPGLNDSVGGHILAPVSSPTPQRLLADWRIVTQEGWVRDERLAMELTGYVQQVVRWLEAGRSGAEPEAIQAIADRVQKQGHLLEPEAQALLRWTIPALLGR